MYTNQEWVDKILENHKFVAKQEVIKYDRKFEIIQKPRHGFFSTWYEPVREEVSYSEKLEELDECLHCGKHEHFHKKRIKPLNKFGDELIQIK